MFRLPVKTFRAAAIAIPALLATVAAIPANAQLSVSIGFDDFHSRLAPYGTWSNNPRWGEVWHPTRVNRDFRPYSDGHWANTREYGVVWVSNESWGDVPYHYGRWVFDPREGWLWVPGYVWGPSWVVWRSGGGNIGWFPMPPGDNYYGDGAYRDNFASEYGYRDWYGPSFGNDQFLSLWIFVGQDHFADRDYRNYAIPQRDYVRFISQTTNTTDYVTINNYVVNRSIDQNRLPRGTNRLLQPVPASTVFGRNAAVTQAGVGRQVEQRERQQHPIPVNINPAEQSRRGNQNSSAQQQNPVQTPLGSELRRGQTGSGSIGVVKPNRQIDRGAAAGIANPTGPATDTSRQNGRSLANINPADQRGRGNTNLPQPNVLQGSQDPRNRGDNRGFNSNGPVQLNLQTGRPANPAANNGGPANPQIDHSNQTFHAPQTRGAPEPNGKVIVQDSRTSPRVQGDAPAAAHAVVNQQGNAIDNQARGNKQGDAKNAGEHNAADSRKKN